MGIARWPEGVPRTFDEMFRKYAPCIANEIRRHNVVAAHYEDHYQSVCEKLMAAQVLTRFVARVNKTAKDDELPPEMTATEVCDLFGITFGAWRSKMWSYHKVFVRDMRRKIPSEVSETERVFTYAPKGATAKGIMTEAGFTVLKGSTALKNLHPNLTPGFHAMKKSLIASGTLVASGGLLKFTADVLFESPSGAAGVVYGNNANGRVLWKTADGTALKDVAPKAPTKNRIFTAPEGQTHGTINRRGKDISWVSWMPTPVKGGYGSPKAVYKTSDVLEIPERGYFRTMTFDTAAWPRKKVQPHHFQAYLLQAVRNHFSNACRTIMRRHKDRPGDCFPQFKGADGEYNTSWEDSLPDQAATNAFAHVEAAHDLKRSIAPAAVNSPSLGLDSRCQMTLEQRGEISELLETHTIIEVVRMSAKLTRDQKQLLLGIAEG